MLVQEYQAEWAQEFRDIADILRQGLSRQAQGIHHVGSTSIPGMLAKPILDIIVEMSPEARLDDVTRTLAELGYAFEGDKGIPDRYAYRQESNEVPYASPRRRWMSQHLYVCPSGTAELARALSFRDSLVAAAELREEYQKLKEQCVNEAKGDRKIYQARKEEWGDSFFKRVHAMAPIHQRVNGAHDLLSRVERELEAGAIDEREWYRQVAAVITPAYLAADNPRGQSGYSGDGERWRQARGLVAEPIDRDGTFLDVGCASGHLMETLSAWTMEKGVRIEPYGLDIAPELAELARMRLPRWADRIFVGNAIEWRPERKFDYVRTGLEYVPLSRRRDLIEHLLKHMVAPGGRLIIGVYNEAAASIVQLSNEELVRSWGLRVAGSVERPHRDYRLRYRVTWIDNMRE